MHRKIIVITGAASGLGLALARELARLGGILILADRDAAAAKRAARSIQESGGIVDARKLDISNARATERFVETIVKEYGRIDYFFNNAGVSIRGETRDLKREDWERLFAVNLYGTIHAGNAVFKVMVKQGSGHLINTASASGLVPLPVASPYSTSKFAVVGYSENLRLEGADLGVRVSVVCPGFIRSGIRNSPAVNVPQKESFQVPFKEMSAEDAARRIIQGVERNKGRIVFPFYVHLLYLLHVHLPSISSRIGRRMIRNFRKLRGTG